MALELPFRTSNPSKLNTGLLSLPPELISAICSELCLHCRIDRVVEARSDAATAAVEDQRVISRLSQCSRRLRDIAQPALFHWYHGLEEEEYFRYAKRLASFVDAVIRNPGLAVSVRALALYDPDSDARPRCAFALDEIYRPTAEALGGHLAYRSPWSSKASVSDMCELAMAILPGLSQLRLQAFYDLSGSVDLHWSSWSYDMHSLTYLAFSGARKGDPREEGTYHIHEAKSLLRHTPNLRTLIAPDCSGGREIMLAWDFAREPWDVPLPKL